jgi:hypothetical protein
MTDLDELIDGLRQRAADLRLQADLFDARRLGLEEAREMLSAKHLFIHEAGQPTGNLRRQRRDIRGMVKAAMEINKFDGAFPAPGSSWIAECAARLDCKKSQVESALKYLKSNSEPIAFGSDEHLASLKNSGASGEPLVLPARDTQE